MKHIEEINQGWAFVKNCANVPAEIPSEAVPVDLPHTWNALDGQDGGSDYWCGPCCYMKKICRPEGKNVYVEVEAASSCGKIVINGVEKELHKGGYSAFRADITADLKDGENLLAIWVDNSPRTDVYPQTADFTFYGGLYRGVKLITADDSRFDLDYFGGKGLMFSSDVKEDGAAVISLDAYITNPQENQSVEFVIRDAQGKPVADAVRPAAKAVHAEIRLENPHLWQGVEDPYLYEVQALLMVHNEPIDEVCGNLGIRTYYVDPAKGFFLNGRLTPLRGVSRHQDRLGVGNALTRAQHEEDVALIREVGANTVRLAHYQHNQYFYDACDRAGLVVWAEIPFISVMSEDPAAHENCRSQMTELIVQNYNHPSICFWGLSNEITIAGKRPGMTENHQDLNKLVKELDPTRLTTMAAVSMLPMSSDLNQITDVVSYNHYFGWYMGKLEDNEKWFDNFHAQYPDRAIGISEYGAEGIISFHSDEPKCKDYTEEYQAVYHEHMLRMIEDRPWLWATHLWNMFDFGCDSRDEGDVKGRNNKGLMTIDRKVRKDSFYLYKAYWSDEKFVHLCSRRYAQRVGDETTVKVYSNLPKVTLTVNGRVFAEQEGSRVFVFEHVPMGEGFTFIGAKAGEYSDSMTLEKVAQANPAYTYVDPDEDDSEGAKNWFELSGSQEDEVTELIVNEGCFSVYDKIGDIIASKDAGDALVQFVSMNIGMKLKRSMLGMMKHMTVLELAKKAGQMIGKNGESNEEGNMKLLIRLNEVFNKIKK